MEIIVFLSEAAVPLIVAVIVSHGLLSKTDVYSAFVEGAAEGIKTVAQILPTLIGLMTAVGAFSGSGALTAATKLISPLPDALGFPKEAVPLIFMRLVSASASTGLLLDIFKVFGPDSFIGRYVSVLFSSTETVFYTMAVYFMSVKVVKTRHTLACALFCSAMGVAASFFLTKYVFGY